MKRNTAIALCAVVVMIMLRSTAANAQTASGIEYVELPPAIAACLAECTSGTARTTAVEAAELARRVAKLERDYAALSRRVGLLSRSRGPDPTAELARMRTEIGQLRTGLDALTRVTEDEMMRAGIAVYNLEQGLDEVKKRLTAMEGRIDALERKGNGIHIAPLAGFLVLWSTDGTLYTGGPVGARLKLNLTDSLDVNIDGAALLSVSDAPVGSSVRGGLTFDLNERMAIETGLSASWVGYNSQLLAKSAFVTGDIGLTFRYGRFWATASFLTGAEFDGNSPGFALGGNAIVGVEFP